MDRADLVQDVADLANAYLSKGVAIPGVQSVAPTDRIKDLSALLRRYFVLTGHDCDLHAVDPAREQPTPDLVPFLGKLPGRLKRIKMTTDRELEVSRDTIEGRIDWQETIKARARRGTADRRLFAYHRTDEHVDNPENRVLATLVDRVYDVVNDDLEAARDAPTDYPWLDVWTDPENRLWETVKRLQFESPYLSTIDVPATPIPDPTIETVKTARSPLYREAARLLDRYQRYQRGDYTRQEFHALFDTLFVGPAAMDELFELYWAYKLASAYDDYELVAQTGESDAVARWTSSTGSEYRLQYRTTSSDPPTFHVGLSDASPELEVLDEEFPDDGTYLQRHRAAVERGAAAKEALLGMSGVRRHLWNGEPDLLLTKRASDTGELEGVFVGEVKYAESGTYQAVRRQARQGLEDLTEYMALLRDGDGQYLAGADSDVPVRGGLFLPAFDPPRVQASHVRITTYGDMPPKPLE